MLIMTHITACIWFLLACASLSMGSDVHTCDVGSWALKEPFVKPLSRLTYFMLRKLSHDKYPSDYY